MEEKKEGMCRRKREVVEKEEDREVVGGFMVFSATVNNISAILWGLGRCGEEGGKLGREYKGGSGECGGEGRGGWGGK